MATKVKPFKITKDTIKGFCDSLFEIQEQEKQLLKENEEKIKELKRQETKLKRCIKDGIEMLNLNKFSYGSVSAVRVTEDNISDYTETYLDVDAFRENEPELYAEVLEKYHKISKTKLGLKMSYV